MLQDLQQIPCRNKNPYLVFLCGILGKHFLYFQTAFDIVKTNKQAKNLCLVFTDLSFEIMHMSQKRGYLLEITKNINTRIMFSFKCI